MKPKYISFLFLTTNTFAFIMLGFCAAEPTFMRDQYEWGVFFWVVAYVMYTHRNKAERKIMYDNYISKKGDFYTLLIAGPIFWFMSMINNKLNVLESPGTLKLFIVLTIVALGTQIIRHITPQKYEDYEKRAKRMWWPFK